jgi:hypothetical protein
MAITFKSAGHFLATVLQKVLGTEKTVETVTAATSAIEPVYGPLALTIEKAGYAVLGELSAVLNSGSAAASAKLADAGLDINVIQTVEALLAGIPQFAALIKGL